MTRPTGQAPLTLEERQARARQLARYDAALVEVLEPEQHLPGLLEHLGAACQVILDAAQKLWPKQSWESTSQGGPPEVGDLHVKVVSVITDADPVQPLRDGVALRIGISAIITPPPSVEFGPEPVIYVPLALAEPLVKALLEQLAYWHENPPNG